MKISYNWLKEYIHIELPPDEVAGLLTSIGLEVENLEKFESVRGGLKGVVVGEVLTCTKHPDADRLSLTTVNIGNGIVLPIVCGAPNVAAGQKVLVATIGTKLFMGDREFEIKKARIRGAVSEGMICAEDELGLGSSHEGIMVLPDDAIPGTPAAEYFDVEEDWVFEIGLTPNRTDAMSHIGVARELAAVLNFRLGGEPLKVFYPDDSAFRPDNNNLPIEVIVEDFDACPRYCGVTISGVKVEESPRWLQNRLMAIGVRPINNLVDISNYILHETGHPNHFFDADKIAGQKVIIKKEPRGTHFVTLDGITRELSGDDLMICDAEKGMCMAGIFGGLHSGITEQTTRVFIESAYFNPATIRKSARFHGLHTDSSFRFERGADPNAALYALKLAALMVKRIAGGQISSAVVDIYPRPIKKKMVKLHFDFVNRLVGQSIPRETVKDILVWLGMEPHCETDHSILVDVPTFRTDVEREADLVEEILRIYGYDNVEIPSRLRSSLSFIPKPDREKLQNLAADYLSSRGFYEIINNSLTRAAYAEETGIYRSESNVIIKNPLSNDLNALRQTLITSGLETIILNIHHRNSDLKLFEFGTVYSKILPDSENDPLSKYRENNRLAIFITGRVNQENWHHPPEDVDFFFLKNIVHDLLKRFGLNAETDFQSIEIRNEVFDQGIQMSTKDRILVSFGILNKRLLNYFEIRQDVFMADFDWDVFIQIVQEDSIQYTPLAKFPEVRRDLALVIDKTVQFETLRNIAFETENRLLKEVNLFDVYEGEKIGQGKKSYAISFILRDDTKTLTDEEIDRTMERLLQAFRSRVGAVLR